ncbi:BLOC-3 complex member HPS1-like [Clavelina lepadiformis]|uniref:BLOC-3 complex member HPS1-like n=1 Tax=Clavelina lepadiformis TaxID=159417 RepID=UPI0040424F96
MKAIVVVEETSEIIYLWHDDEFKETLLHTMDSCTSDSSTFDVYVQMYFAPIILSYFTLKSKLNESCMNIECDSKKVSIVFLEHQRFLFIGLEEAETLCNEKIYRQLCFLQHSFDFMFGLCSRFQLTDNSRLHKAKSRNSITCLLEAYMKLCASENAFLFEAIEKLKITSDVSDVAEVVLKKCTNSVRAAISHRNVQHAFIFAGSRLVAYHTTGTAHFSLSTGNMLHIMSMMSSKLQKVKHRGSDSLTDETRSSDVGSEDYSQSETSRTSFPSAPEDVFSGGDMFSGDDDIFLKTDVDTVIAQTGLVSQPSDSQVENPSVTLYEADVSPKTAAQSRNRIKETTVDFGIMQEGFDLVHDHFSSEEDLSTSNAFSDPLSSEDESVDLPAVEECYEVPIYLTTSKSHTKNFIPHILYCIPVTSQVKMVFVSREKHADISDVICAMIFLLNQLKFESGVLEISGQHTVENLERCNKLLHAKMKKFKASWVNLTRKITQSWHATGQKNLKSLNHRKPNREQIALIERCVNETQHRLYVLYRHLFPSFVDHLFQDSCSNIQKIQRYAQSKFAGYIEYLSVKSQQNVSITSFLSRFPGLVYFAFTRRSRECEPSLNQTPIQDEIYAPSFISSSSSDFVASVYQCLKRKFWCNVYKFYDEMLNGKFQSSAQDGDFQFTNQVWLATKQKPEVEIQVSPTDDLTLCRSSSIFCGKFYRNLSSSNSILSTSFFVYQLVCVHLAMVPETIITEQIKNLTDIVMKHVT